MRHAVVGAVVALLVGWAAEPASAAAQDAADARDLGIGIVTFEAEPMDARAVPWADTMVVRSVPADGGDVVALFIYEIPRPFTWGYRLDAREAGLAANGLEYDYEVQGLAADSVVGGGAWARVLAAVDERDGTRRGWVRLRAGQTALLLWPDVLRDRPLFFRDAEAIAFHEAPGGPAVRIDLAASPWGPGADYRLEPLEVEGRWMRARVVTPDASCTAEAVDERAHTAWLEYLDPAGRPRVWYHTRGC